MEPDRPAPPPLVSTVTNVGPSSSSLPGLSLSSPPPVTDATSSAPTNDFARFQQMLVEAMKDTRVRAAVLPGPDPPAHVEHGELPKNTIHS